VCGGGLSVYFYVCGCVHVYMYVYPCISDVWYLCSVEVSAAGVKWKSLSKDGISQLVSCSLQSKSYTFNIMVKY